MTSMLLIVLVLLEATPSHPRMQLRDGTPQCEIAATVRPVELLALASERATSAGDPGGFERMPLSPFAFCASPPPSTQHLSRMQADGTLHGHERSAWFQPRQPRARSPDDPDPF